MKLELRTLAATKAPARSEILFIHGVYHAAWAWENFQPYFAERGYTSHALSLRGHGASGGHERLRSASFADFLDDVAQTIARFERPPILIGHSLGGMLIQRYLQHADAPAAVLISTPTPRTMRGAGPRLALLYPGNILRFLLTMNPDHIYKDSDLVRGLLFSPDESDAALEDAMKRILAQAESRRIILDVSLLRMGKPRRAVPALVIGGAQDFALARSNFEETARLYGTEPVLFEDMPHDLMLAPGWEAVAESIVRWLDRQFPASHSSDAKSSTAGEPRE